MRVILNNIHALQRPGWAIASIIVLGAFLACSGVFASSGPSTTTRVSVDSDGIEGNHFSVSPSISGNGRYVAFSSWASNLVDEDTNGISDIFVHDRKRGTTTRVSVDSNGNEANDSSRGPSISGNGRYVAFWSDATNLVDGDTNFINDIFVHDRKRGTTTRVSVDINANEAGGAFPSISRNGRYVAFLSSATTISDVFVHDRKRGTTTQVSVDSSGNKANGFSTWPSISGNGRYVAFRSRASNLVNGDTNVADDIFVHDRKRGTTTRVSVDSNGNQANGFSIRPSISGNGRYVAFSSRTSNLIQGDTNGASDVFVHDRKRGTTTRVNVDSNGIQANGFGDEGIAISNTGRHVAFVSDATNLVVEGDTNGSLDVFVHQQ